MIDGCDAERVAIEKVFPDIPIRACQFHFMQAIRGKIRSVLGNCDDRDRKVSAIFEAICVAQRCDSEDSWQACHDELGTSMTAIVGDDGRA